MEGWKVGRGGRGKDGRVEGWKGGGLYGLEEEAQSRMNVLRQYQEGWGREKGVGGRLEEGKREEWKVGGLYGLEEEAQSNRMCYGSIKMDEVGKRG